MSASSAQGLAGIARRTYNAAFARVFPAHSQQVTPAASIRIPFRPQLNKPAKSQISASSAQDPSSISGLRFCLHMVAFAVPGVVLSKKLCDGERLEDIAQSIQDTATDLANKVA
ncbi:hypothetical protein BGX31_001128 [Mortierella sp. GBA43]|nr:hypothetical protein BGX31_001128 [Mortierella sp. GBA43]